MKSKRIFKAICLGILIAVLANGFGKMFIYSKYIDESNENLISKYEDIYFIFPYAMGEHAEGVSTMRFGMLGGNLHLGTLAVTNDTTINIQTKKNCGALKILLANYSTEDVTCNSLLLESEDTIELKTGRYQVYLIGNWFSGNCRIDYADAEFDLSST